MLLRDFGPLWHTRASCRHVRGSPMAAGHFCEQYRYSSYWRIIKTLAASSHNRVMQNVTRNIKLNMRKTVIVVCRQYFFPLFPCAFFPIFAQDTSKSGFGDGQRWGWTPQSCSCILINNTFNLPLILSFLE